MFHYFNAIQNTKGDALIGYYVKLRDSNGDEVDIFADENSTPIISVSEVANAAKVDSDGNAEFYVAGGTYSVDIYATNATSLVKTISNVPMIDLAAVEGLTDGDKGDITVANSFADWTINNNAVTYGKIQAVSATDKVLGRSSSGSGDVEEIACTAAGRALLDDADASAQRTTLGLGSIATQASSSVSITGGSIAGITDLALADGGTGASLSDPNADRIMFWDDSAGQVTWLTAGTGLSISGTSISVTGAALADGDYGDITASSSGTVLTIDSNVISTFGRTLTDDADASAARTTLGLGSIATQASSSVSITGGSITGITDLAVADGGTGASSASAARTNLGLVIGTDVQAYSLKLATIAANTVSSQTGTTYTAVLGDADTYIRFSNASSITFTIPPNSSVAFPVGTVIEMEQAGAGALSVAAGSGVTINSRGSDLTLAGQYSVAAIKKVATDTWTLTGDL